MKVGDQGPEVSSFQIWQCLNESCRFRFPALADSQHESRCPRCQGPAFKVGAPFAGRGISPAISHLQALNLEVLLDNVRSSNNVGSIFRSCDGAGIRHVHLCGITSTPRQGKVGKAALGAEGTVPWSYHRNGVDATRARKQEGYRIWSLENRVTSQSIFDLRPDDLAEQMLLVVGNELSGVDPAILDLSDRIISIPMMGQKSSLNAAVAFGIVAYRLRFGVQHRPVSS
jgi:23S rRNA (guanosine2251-2'-O)-methyltransferase